MMEVVDVRIAINVEYYAARLASWTRNTRRLSCVPATFSSSELVRRRQRGRSKRSKLISCNLAHFVILKYEFL